MKSIEEKSWEELQRAIRNLWIDKCSYSKECKIKFCKHDANNTISIFIEGIDNVYDIKNNWKWEIFLNSNGTWKIT